MKKYLHDKCMIAFILCAFMTPIAVSFTEDPRWWICDLVGLTLYAIAEKWLKS